MRNFFLKNDIFFQFFPKKIFKKTLFFLKKCKKNTKKSHQKKFFLDFSLCTKNIDKLHKAYKKYS